MNKKVLNQLEKIIISVVIFLVLAAVLFILTSCKSDYQKALEGDIGSAANESTVNTTDQAATSENETASQSSENGTDTAAETETTSETTNPTAKIIIVAPVPISSKNCFIILNCKLYNMFE